MKRSQGKKEVMDQIYKQITNRYVMVCYKPKKENQQKDGSKC